MQFLTYFLASVISFLGLVIGIILARVAPEEKKALGAYLSVLRKVSFAAILFFAALYYFKSIMHLLALGIFLASAFFMESSDRSSLIKSAFIYALLGIILFLSSANRGLFVLEASLITVYGLAAGSLLYNARQKNYPGILSANATFLITANALFFLPFLISYP